MNNILDNLLKENKKPNLEDFINDFEKAEYLQKLLINMSTNDGPTHDDHYAELRRYFMKNAKTKQLLPRYVIDKRDLSQFWQFIKNKFPSYAERREFIWNDFNKLLEHLENQEDSPLIGSIDENLRIFNSEHVLNYWNTAIERKENDPEGAITISRTLVEGVLKNILDEKNINYSKNANLHDIYKLVANELYLSPEQHNLQLFKQILGGCSSIVNGLGNLRNIHGDAHGKGKVRYYKPSSRHAELAVNLAGSMSLFLIQTHRNDG
ncbi:abortive infection family protein [Lentibacillus amyloliquefaciens]|uniref:Abortive phage resistance protein n=1 Tax=Lentibacillus amyloliquefaciens TaxID=1472767 RepID=A0A0U3NL88_9BACI|nr:abortive infection family protein [Lentibacillus amyloliquefaciens]ALX47563.1 abortive phage resistance protein [Lentibacillus amyloliquefaciens]